MKFTNEDSPHYLVEEINRLRRELAIAKAEMRAVERLFKMQAELYSNLHDTHEHLLAKHYPTKLVSEIHNTNHETNWLAQIRAWLKSRRP